MIKQKFVNIRLMASLLLLFILPVSKGFTQTSQLIFNQLSTQFLTVNQNATIPISVSSLSSSDKVQITRISGLPGATYQASSTILSSIANGNIYWAPVAAGSYAAIITAVDNTTGLVSTATVAFNVNTAPYNVSPVFSPINVQAVNMNGTMVLNVSANRAWAPGFIPAPKLTLTASGLPGTITMQNMVSTTTGASATVVWTAPLNVINQNYFLTLQVSDAYGAYTQVQVPVYVGATIPALVFNQLSTQFLTVNQNATIPISVNSVSSTDRVQIINISGLPGASYQASSTILSSIANGNIYWAPVAAGSYTAQITAVDQTLGTSITAYVTFNVNTAPYNVSPVFSPINVQAVNMNGTMVLNVSANRAWAPGFIPAPKLTLTASGLPGTITMQNMVSTTTGASATVEWTAPLNVINQNYFLTLQVSDAYGAYTQVQVPVYVGATIPALVFNQLSTQFLTVNQNATIPISVNSVSSTDRVQIINISGLPGASYQASSTILSSIANGNIYWAPVAAGSYTAQITAVDQTLGTSITAYVTFNVNTAPYNVSPVFSPINVQAVNMNGTMVLNVSANRAWAPGFIPAPKLTLTASGLPGTITMQNMVSTTTGASATVVWTAPLNVINQNYFLTLQVSDAYGAYTQVQVPVYVGATIPALVFNQLSTQFLTVNQNATIPISVNSVSSTDRVQIINISGLPGASYQASSTILSSIANGNIYWAPVAAGSYTAQITAVDQTLGTSITAYVTFNVNTPPYNVSPVFSPINVQAVNMNGTMVLNVSANRAWAPGFIPAPKLTLTASGLPGTITMQNMVSTTTGASATVEWTAPLNVINQNYFLTLQVSDAYGAYTQVQVPVYVGATIPALVFNQLSTQFLTVNQNATIPISVNSVSSTDRVQIINISGLPGASYQASSTILSSIANGNIYWAPVAAGSYTAQITAVDQTLGTSITAYVTFNVNTAPYNVSPVFSPINVQAVNMNGTMVLNVSANRAWAPGFIPAPKLTLTASGLPGTITMQNMVSTTTGASATVEWTAPLNVINQNYFLTLQVSDAYGAYTQVQVPVYVG